MADKIGSILDLPTSKAGAALDALKQDVVKNRKAYAGIPDQDLAHIYSADLEHLPAMANLLGLEKRSHVRLVPVRRNLGDQVGRIMRLEADIVALTLARDHQGAVIDIDLHLVGIELVDADRKIRRAAL